MKMHVWIAMSNLPGCMPDSDPAWFTNRRDAERYIREIQGYARQVEDDLYDGSDPYVYSVTREVVARPGDRSIDARYARYVARCRVESCRPHDRHMWTVHNRPTHP